MSTESTDGDREIQGLSQATEKPIFSLAQPTAPNDMKWPLGCNINKRNTNKVFGKYLGEGTSQRGEQKCSPLNFVNQSTNSRSV
jgi:hypothetical protein